MALHRLDLLAVLEGMRAGRFTSEEFTRDCLERISKLEPQIHAFAWLDPQAALEKARHADRARKAGNNNVLLGVPLGVKDIVHTRGIPTRMGSPLFEEFVPTESATAVRRLEDAGAFVLGKTVTTELAYFHPGPTRNPWNPAHTPGGSSMGSAAAVAAGFVPGAIGTQTNGSVIRPAAFCGVVGYKPSQGAIGRAGILAFAPTLDQVGVFARTVRDAALLARSLAGHDPSDPQSLRDSSALDFEVRTPIPPPRLAAVRSPVWTLAEEAQQRVFAESVESFTRAGAKVEPLELSKEFDGAHGVLRQIMAFEAAREFGSLQERARAQLSAELNALLDEGHTIAVGAYREALARRERLQVELAPALARFDAILTPPACGEAPATLERTGDPAFCTIWTLTGVPAITIPAALGPHGLPLGLQLVGGYLHDSALLSVAQWCAEQLRFTHQLPQ